MAKVVYWANKKRVLPGVRAVIGNSASGDAGVGGGGGGIIPPASNFVITLDGIWTMNGIWTKRGVWLY